MNHPTESQLALFCGNDLGRFERWRVRRHVAECGDCAETVASFGTVRNELKAQGEQVPAGIHWPRLADEMTGNIRVGLAAGECIEAFEKRPRDLKHGLGWHAAMVLAGATAVMIFALWIRLPQPELDRVLASFRKIRVERIGQFVRTPVPVQDGLIRDGIVLDATAAAIEVKASGGTFSLLRPAHQNNRAVAVTVSMQGSAGARYVDEDTGQVTTNRVYYAQ